MPCSLPMNSEKKGRLLAKGYLEGCRLILEEQNLGKKCSI